MHFEIFVIPSERLHPNDHGEPHVITSAQYLPHTTPRRKWTGTCDGWQLGSPGEIYSLQHFPDFAKVFQQGESG
jgi:hypothetical protein